MHARATLFFPATLSNLFKHWVQPQPCHSPPFVHHVTSIATPPPLFAPIQ